MKKLYFTVESERCYTEQEHREQMKENNETDRTLFEAKIDRESGMFFCREFGEIGEKNETCGKQCSKYTPRNKKSGICKHYGFCYSCSEKFSKIVVNFFYKPEAF